MSNVPKGVCSSCPYLKSTPPGVWTPDHYDMLPEYDKETFEQPAAVFHCHHDNGDLCGGWLTTHNPEDLLSLRLALSKGTVDLDELIAFDQNVDKSTCYESGQEACDAGKVVGDAPPEA